MPAFARLILTFWAGGLWTICCLVVPGLFWLMDDRRLAGNIAAQFFYLEVFLSVILGGGWLWLMRGRLSRRSMSLAWAAILAPVAFYVVLRPIMSAVRATGDMARFGQLHTIGSLLFLIACIATAMLVWRSDANR